jgi:hypothetical protein
MPNLIVDVVPAAQTGEATGFNALVRTSGSSLGAQVCAAILAGGTIAGGVSESAYRTAFLLSAGGALVAALLALCIPRPGPGTHVSALVEAGGASMLAEPPSAGER